MCSSLHPDRSSPHRQFNGTLDVRHVTGPGVAKQGERKRMSILLDIEHIMARSDPPRSTGIFLELQHRPPAAVDNSAPIPDRKV
jgi:hypothetical protein